MISTNTGGDEQNDERRPRFRGQLVLPRRHDEVEAARCGVGLGMILVQRGGQLLQLGLRARGGGAGREPRIDRGHAMRPLVLHR
jgi:hypothetical protein